MRLLEIMRELGALKVQPKEPFTWASGYKMPVYNDNRALLAAPEARQLIAEGFKNLAKPYLPRTEAIIGCATAGIPHATSLADAIALPTGYVRSKAKDHGTQNKLEGFNKKGAKVVLVEDLISTGKSSLEAARALQSAGLEVHCCLAIFSYGFEESKKAFQNAEIPVHTLLTLDDITWLSNEEQDLLETWKRDPFNWTSTP